jgi:hypothetical protein
MTDTVASGTKWSPHTLWTNYACLIPLAGVPLAWLISVILSRWMIGCGGELLLSCRAAVLFGPLSAGLKSLGLSRSDPAVRAAYDIAARFAWQPTLVTFVVVALGSGLACWYLAHRSLVESLPDVDAENREVVILVGGVLIGVVGWHSYPQWVVHTEVLQPILAAAFSDGSHIVSAASTAQRLFQVLAVLASYFVIAAASAALLTPTRDQRSDAAGQIRHLTEQWRRLSFTLFAGAVLLVSAVVHQTALYGWGAAFSKALLEAEVAATEQQRAAVDTARVSKGIAAARLSADTFSFKAESLSPPLRRAAIARRDTLRRKVAATTYVVDSLSRLFERDTAVATARARRLAATMDRVNTLTAAAITRGAGLVYSVLLAMTYLPAALVLMERAREISESASGKPTESERAKWRIDRGIGFSIGTQWSKALAVLSPLLASGSAAVLLKIFE